MRKHEVARICDVSPAAVAHVGIEEVARVYADRQSSAVLECLEAAPADFWRVGDRYFFDDPGYGDVAEIDQLDYDSTLGLIAKGGNA